MLLDLSNDVRVVQQFSQHQWSFVTDLQSLCLQHDHLLTFHSTHLTGHLPLLNTNKFSFSYSILRWSVQTNETSKNEVLFHYEGPQCSAYRMEFFWCMIRSNFSRTLFRTPPRTRLRQYKRGQYESYTVVHVTCLTLVVYILLASRTWIPVVHLLCLSPLPVVLVCFLVYNVHVYC